MHYAMSLKCNDEYYQIVSRISMNYLAHRRDTNQITQKYQIATVIIVTGDLWCYDGM